MAASVPCVPGTAALEPQPLHLLHPPGFFDGKTSAEERQRYLLETIRASAQVGCWSGWHWVQVLAAQRHCYISSVTAAPGSPCCLTSHVLLLC